jgi:hypothetical protein
MMELINKLDEHKDDHEVTIGSMKKLAQSLLEAEKKQIVDAFNAAYHVEDADGENYFTTTYQSK